MSIENTLMQRGDSKCELCGTNDQLSVYDVPPVDKSSEDKAVLTCITCKTQLNDAASVDVNHWRCLNDAMWSQVPAVQVVAYRMLHQLNAQGETWCQDLLDMMYMEEDTRAWADLGLPEEEDPDAIVHRDSNGDVIVAGDTVHLIKDLVVKGGNFTAKRGTPVRNIGVTNNPLHIEGRVNGQRIVILTEFVKKSKHGE
ncbi:alkylphosphonate utilization protein [Ferrimonas sp. SCSIO 43195]|uniref:PhnA domain-containing protein n=1 Tax=Ferrimonas sp. SCSIO 43195 TaxID=2822844 RepID=UPI002074DD26|nr:alkylphosphonate utilization protein [Ferrimonas sp. SCSIO 43195]USD36881.1 PhnA domain-containing protein [Ferrimonas sp. SCSIO 43195]